MTDCKVCKHPKALGLMHQVFAGKLSYTDAAKMMNLPIPTVWKCFKEHWETQVTESGVAIKLKQAKSTEDYVGILKDLIEKFINRLDTALSQPVSAYNDAAVTRLSKEMRGLMRDILEFEGKLKVGPLIQLNILQAQFTKLTSLIVSDMCSECQAKLLKALPELAEKTEVTA